MKSVVQSLTTVKDQQNLASQIQEAMTTIQNPETRFCLEGKWCFFVNRTNSENNLKKCRDMINKNIHFISLTNYEFRSLHKRIYYL